MGATLGNLKKRRRQPDPRTIKKHSDIVGREHINMVVGGVREKTPTGYIVKGFSGKSFETYFEYMLAKSSSAVFMHEKKDKTVRVLSGVLYVILEDGKTSRQIKAIAGDEVVLERGTAYRLATSAETVQLIACQNSKYNATLQVVNEGAIVSQEVSPHLLQEPDLAARTRESRPQDVRNTRRGSKAKEQLAAQRAGKNSPQVVDQNVKATVSTTFGKNPKPSQGRFNEEGAG